MNPYNNRDKTKVLFICKTRQLYGKVTPAGYTTGLCLSAELIRDMLVAHHVNADVVGVVDNNDIDRVVTQYKPTVVIIEALWVVPEKFAVLKKLHPEVNWIVRIHSETPFIAGEGMALDWLMRYWKTTGVFVGANSDRMVADLQAVLPIRDLFYLPNYYPLCGPTVEPKPITPHYGRINIGCFGALRLLKNQLESAIAAIEFGDRVGRAINFHINVERKEGGGDNVLRNLRSLFNGVVGHRLVEHAWLDHAQFLVLVRQMDLGIQVSLSETFNIVAADFVSQLVPIVVSDEVRWLSAEFRAKPTATPSIVNRLLHLWDNRFKLPLNAYELLVDSNSKAVTRWLDTLRLPLFQP